ncbi:phosphatase PAP2 family protein [Fulvivirga sp. RKSG066]|uniref:phosphatase PAP2 family protein n=1 Tax=Fulvivirga aurantia TaxID=2529383 RepID=UPI0012BCF86B|nr:phosphatase PAP2 family protein [Fulvivirga aurantia]MTI21330.1 phosphatase PAP2 family protein [Fulvivirga aurantia]
MWHKVKLAFIFLLVLATQLHAQDSLNKKKKWTDTKVFKVSAVPVALTTLGLITTSSSSPIDKFDVRESINERFPDFSSSFDDYLRYVPPASVYLLDLAGVEPKNDLGDRTILFLKSNILALAITFPLKGLTKVRRPDGSSSASFPSLHTAQAFLGATFLHKELGHKSVWYSVAGYAMAATTGFYRMLNNKHWVSDVLVGAAVGIFSANLAYATHQFKPIFKRKDLKLSVLPTYNRGPGLTILFSR